MAYNTNYQRIIPRDLFNEANLLKCYAQLWLLLERYQHKAELGPEDVRRFAVGQDPNSGNLTVTNLTFKIGGRVRQLERPLNSREPWPLFITGTDNDPDDEIRVFDNQGNFSTEMLALLEPAEVKPAPVIENPAYCLPRARAFFNENGERLGNQARAIV